MCLCRLVLTLSHEGGWSVPVPVRVSVRPWSTFSSLLRKVKGDPGCVLKGAFTPPPLRYHPGLFSGPALAAVLRAPPHSPVI